MQSNTRKVDRSGMRWLGSILLLVSLWACISLTAWAQVTVGSVTGVVTDPTGAVVPGAKVHLIDTNKGFTYNAVTDSVGRYQIMDVPASNYKITVEAGGFKSVTQEGIILDVASKLAVDVKLQIGATTQTVEVVGAAPVLSTQDAVTGQEINRSAINDLPLVDRSVLDLAFLAPGVTQVPGAAYGTGTSLNFVSNGGRNDTAELLVDGITAASYEPNTAIYTPLFQPNVDAVQEFKIMQNNYSAEEGFSGNTYINMVMRSGTDQFHGDVYEFLRNRDLDANNWFSNASGGQLPSLRKNEFGGSVGGPIKKDKTFFFFDFDGVRESAGATAHGGVPDAAERTGDFGELCARAGGAFDAGGICQGAPNGAGQLWDPYSGAYGSWSGYGNSGTGRYLQTPIPFNNLALFTSAGNSQLAGTGFQLAPVAGNLIDPVASKMMSYYPMPNNGSNPYDNWTGSGANTDTNNQWDLRIDHRFTQNDTFNARYSQSTGTYHNYNCYGNALDPCTQGPGVGGSRQVALNLNHTFSPTTILSVSLGFTRGLSDTQGVAKDFPKFNPVSGLGLPSYITTDGTIASPNIYMYGGYSSPNGSESIGAQPWSVYKNGNQVYHLLATVTHIQGRHELKFGGEWRVQQMNWFQDGVPGGLEIADQYGTSQYPNVGGGDAMATFLTGVPDPGEWGEYEVSPHFSTQNYRYGGFAQDNFKATKKLTVNVGLRYDLEIPRTERYNKMSWFDPNQTIDIHPAAVASSSWVYTNAAGNTVAMPFAVPDVTSPKGGLVFASPSQRHIIDTAFHDFGPRVGIAYQMKDKLVFRGGYGLFYNPTQWGTTGAGPVGNEGFEATTSWQTTMNSDGSTPWGRISNPFPTGLLLPTGASLGNQTNLGLGITEAQRNENVPPYTQTWSGGFQYELPGSVLVDVNYIGTKGTHLYFNSAGGEQYFGTWIQQEATNPDLVTALGTYVPNPYAGVISSPGCGICGPTIASGNLIRPYPQINGLNTVNPPWANSIYNALQLKVEKRMRNGLSLMVSYTNAKSIDDASMSTSTGWIGGFGQMRDPNDRKLERSLSEWDIPQVFQFSYIWQVPFGRGKHWGGNINAIVDGFLGGWQTSGMWRFDDGMPASVGVTGALAPWGYSTTNPDQIARLRVLPKSMWFKTNPATGSPYGYFANPSSSMEIPPQYTIGNASRMEPNTRVPGTSNATMAIFKDIPLNKMREGAKLQVRCEAFNALNHPQFGGIVNTFGNASFGEVDSQVNSPRQVQMGLQLYF
ncbi:MAG: TonB-dependent receptor domain-containing protein [Terriglobia bacterium]